jgi:uncharacterized damage-inducible protein DinB
MIDCIKLLFEHNIKCREPLLSSIERDLSERDFTRDLGVGHSSIRNIVVHLVNNEGYWIDEVLKGGGRRLYDPEEVTTVTDVRVLFEEREEKTEEYLSNLIETDLQNVETIIWNGVTNNFTVAKALLHVATHEAHHRGLIIGLIRKLGGQPPDVNML